MGDPRVRASAIPLNPTGRVLEEPHVCLRPSPATFLTSVSPHLPLLAYYSKLCTVIVSFTDLIVRYKLKGAPAHIPLMNRELHLAMPGKQIEGLFRRSSSLVPTPSLFDALYTFFGLSGRDIDIFNHDSISAYESSIGFHTKHRDVSRRIMEHQRQDFAYYLHGRNLGFVMDRFKNNLISELSAACEAGRDLGRVPDLFGFLSDLILRASVEALYGEHLLRICPTFCEDFWAFYKAFPIISKGLPRWYAPSSYHTRDKMHENIARWRAWCSNNFDWDNQDLCDVEYEPIWGTLYVRKMAKRHEALGFSDNGVSVIMLGYLFVYVHALTSFLCNKALQQAFLPPSSQQR